jgi:hypothetical protein
MCECQGLNFNKFDCVITRRARKTLKTFRFDGHELQVGSKKKAQNMVCPRGLVGIDTSLKGYADRFLKQEDRNIEESI